MFSHLFAPKILIGKSKYMEIGRNRGMIANEHMKMGSNSYEKVKTLNIVLYIVLY